MDRKILFSMMMISLVATFAGAGLRALFNDTETSSGNMFTAGTLDLQVGGNDDPDVSVYFSVGDVKPGDSGNVNIELNNTGSLGGNVYIHFKNVVDSPGETPEPEPTPDYGELSQHLYIKVKVDGDVKVEGYLSDIACNEYELGPLNAGGSLTVTVEWSIPSDVGDEIQGDSVSFDMEFILKQA